MTRPLPILYTVPNFITAGSGPVVLNLVRRFDRAEFASAVRMPRRGGALCEELEKLEVPLFEAPIAISARRHIARERLLQGEADRRMLSVQWEET